MENRRKINDQLVQWIKSKAETEFPQDISLVCIYGSYLNGTMNSKSDVDCYFVPKTDRGYKFARTFIINGVGYDIFPMSWERLEEIAKLHSGMYPLLGDVKILFCSNEDDLTRFELLQNQLLHSLNDDTYTEKCATGKCNDAAKLLGSLTPNCSPSEKLKTAGQMIALLADAVAVKHHDYYHFGLKKQYEDLLQRFPAWISDSYRKVIEAETADSAVCHAEDFLKKICAYIGTPAAIPSVSAEIYSACTHVNGHILAGLYQEICSTFNKIYVCCEQDNYILAFLSAVSLQSDLDDAQQFGCPPYALLEKFQYQNLSAFSEATSQIEAEYVAFIRSNGGHIRSYSTFAQFESDQRSFP